MTAATYRELARGSTVWQKPVHCSGSGLLPARNWSETSLSALCFPGLEIRRTTCARRGLPFYFFIFFYFFVTGGSKRSLAVNRMWVYIIRGGQIKKNQSHSVRKMTSNFPSPNRSCKLFSGSFTARKRSSDKKDEGTDLTLPC